MHNWQKELRYINDLLKWTYFSCEPAIEEVNPNYSFHEINKQAKQKQKCKINSYVPFEKYIPITFSQQDFSFALSKTFQAEESNPVSQQY